MLFIADFFVEDVVGGSELCSEEIIKYFQQKYNQPIQKFRSHQIGPHHLKDGVGPVLISNFINLSEAVKQHLIDSKISYYIFEHDHKYCKARNPLTYNGMVVPEHDIQHRMFYKNAKAVFCQSKAHTEVLSKNLWIENVINLGCNLWSDKDLEALEQRIDTVKTRKYGIMQSNNSIKGTRQAVELCKIKNLPYELIPPLPQWQFWDELAKTDTIVFLPQTYETYCRFAIEAKILGCKLITNKAIGAMSEPYWEQNGKELLETIKSEKYKVLNHIDDIISCGVQYWSHFKPQVTLITTVYKGAKYMKDFLDAFVAQDEMKNHELIIIDANSPENEDEIVKPYLENYSNIYYEKLNEKKTTMECFNIATDKAKGDFIAMCMVDDRLAPFHLDLLSKQLFLRSDIDLVYGDTVVVSEANAKWNPQIKTPLFEHSLNDFSKEGMIKNLPGALPMYRRSLHYKIGGYRNEILHGGDWEFYLRAVKNESRFLKINKVVGMYYNNPQGLSTSRDHDMTKERRKSEQQIFEEYREVFGEKVYQQFKLYFDQFR